MCLLEASDEGRRGDGAGKDKKKEKPALQKAGAKNATKEKEQNGSPPSWFSLSLSSSLARPNETTHLGKKTGEEAEGREKGGV